MRRLKRAGTPRGPGGETSYGLDIAENKFGSWSETSTDGIKSVDRIMENGRQSQLGQPWPERWFVDKESSKNPVNSERVKQVHVII